MKHLYLDDTLELLQDRVHDDSADPIYHTLPSYSRRDYNLSFRIPEGHRSHSAVRISEPR